MSTIQDRVIGDHYASTYNGSAVGLFNIARSGLSAGTPNQVLVNDGAGAISSIAVLDTSRGGTGINTSASTGILKVTAGTWTATTITNADVNAAAAIARTKLASGSANQVIINDGAGVLTSEAQLANSRGGTGINTASSTGVAKVSSGTWSVSTIVDADVNAAAAIARTKLASGTNNHVVINNGAGIMTSEAQLATSRGGTGQDFSSVGAGPFIITNSSGVFASTLQYSTASTANSIVQRDGSGNISVGTLSTTQVNTSTVASTGDLTLSSTTNNIQIGTNNIIQTPTTIAGGASSNYTTNLQTVNATPTALFTFPTVSNSLYSVDILVGLCRPATSATGHFKLNFKVKNVAGTVTVSSVLQKASALDAGLGTTNVVPAASGTNFVINVIGVAATTIKWIGTYQIISQTF